MSDSVNKPPHYDFTIQPIDAIEAWGLGYHLGNVIKYVARAHHKGAYLEDLHKAAWYLDRVIANAPAPDGVLTHPDVDPPGTWGPIDGL